jgi:hypothetical protein
MHQRPEMGFNLTTHRKIVRGNWLRTIAWTLLGLVELLMLVRE